MSATPLNVKARLGAMMFLQFAINAMWVVPLVNCLIAKGYGDIKATGSDAISLMINWVSWIGWEYTPSCWAAIVSPLFVGMIADRFFSSEKVMAVLNIVGGGLLFLAAMVVVGPDGKPQPWLFFWVMLAHCLCYMPTWSLTYSITFAHLKDQAREFPVIRTMSTLGWVAGSLISLGPVFGIAKIEETSWPLTLAGVLCVATGIYNFFLPHTPPPAAGKKATIGQLLGFDALGLLKDRNFAVFMATSALILVPACFFWTYFNRYLDEISMPFPQLVQSLSQVGEVVVTLLLAFFLLRMNVKTLVSIGLAAWALRYLAFYFGIGPSMAWAANAPAATSHWTAHTAMFFVSTQWPNFLGLLLHGFAFAFVFTVGAAYVDRKAPKELKASAQGLLAFVTYGLGQLAGTLLGGKMLSAYALRNAAGEAVKDAAGSDMHNWAPYWLWPAAISAVIAVLFSVAFCDKTRLRPEASG